MLRSEAALVPGLSLRTVADAACTDIASWHIGYLERGCYQDRLAGRVRDAVRDQEDRLRHVGELAAQPGSET